MTIISKNGGLSLLLGAIMIAGGHFSGVFAQDSPHSVEIPEPATNEDELEAVGHYALSQLESKGAATAGPRGTSPDIDNDFIVFGYLQNDGMIQGLPWEAMTHIGSEFIRFDSTGTILNPSLWTGRALDLRPGGAAERAGVGVHMVILNDGFNNTVTESVMNNTTNRNNLITEIVALVQNQGTDGATYVQGVSFDLEPFSWSAATNPNLDTFFTDLRSALDTAGLNDMEITWYADPTPSTTQYSNLGDYIDQIDYILYSMYDFGTGNTPRDPSDFDSTLAQTTEYLEDYGVPPHKLVPLISSYSRRFTGTTAYGVAGTSSNTGEGFGDALFATEITPGYTRNYVTGDEASWYTDGSQTFVNPMIEGMEFKVRQALSYQDTSSIYRGRRLGGVGFWSLFWLSELTSYDYVAAGTGSYTRTYPQVYEICQAALGNAGQTRFLLETFESNSNARWEDPNTPDEVGDTDNDSFRIFETAPGGIGAPDTVQAVRVAFDFEVASVGTPGVVHFRHEPLGGTDVSNTFDSNAMAGFFDSTSMVYAYAHSGTSGAPTAYSGVTVAMLLLDADGELERSPLVSLSAGWNELTWDITDNANIFGVMTAEIPFNSGDGVLDSAGGGERDIAFVGFRIEDTVGAGAKSIFFDEVSYEHYNPGGTDYVINEFRYDSSVEFVEIYGPAGALPTGMQLRSYDSSDGTVFSSYNIGGNVIPNDGGGFGYFVVGDLTTPNVDFSNGGTGIDLSNANPGAIQLYDTVTGGVYDSVVYEAHGGLADLIRQQTLGVTDEGYPWLGRFASGTDGSGDAGTAGRYPDGTDTDVNSADFSYMPASPGASNGGSISTPFSTSFNSAPAGVVATFQGVKIENPTGAGLPASTDGGTALRCVDTTGGGSMYYIGDAALGAGGGGYEVTGEIYIPSGAANAQAIGIGFCTSQGSTWFSGSTASGAYEDGYWLLWQNSAAVGLNDGQTDTANEFKFVQASHDNQDGNITDLLGSASDASLGITPGTWTTFRLLIDPANVSGSQLVAQINGNDVFVGNIPTDGPNSGAIAVGFRENHTGAPTSDEGTWIDGLQIGTTVPVGLSAVGLE